MKHKGNVYPGEQDPIIIRHVWDKVQARLKEGPSTLRKGSSAGQTSLLTGLLFDETGDRLTPLHANKKGRRYRYYVSRRLMETDASDPSGCRLPAKEIENAVINTLAAFLNNPRAIMNIMDGQNSTPTILIQWQKLAAQLAETIQQTQIRATTGAHREARCTNNHCDQQSRPANQERGCGTRHPGRGMLDGS